MHGFARSISAPILCAAALAALVACGKGHDDERTPTSAATTTASSSGSGGAGGGGGAGDGGSASCPEGSHAKDGTCAADLSGWTEGSSLSHTRDHHVTFVAETPSGPFLYAIGGAGGVTTRKQMERAPILDDGTLGPFEDIGDLPAGLIGPGLVQDGRSFALIGGLGADSNSVTTTYVGAVADDGAITLTPGPELAKSRYHVSSVLVKGYVFAIGGLYQSVAGGTPTQEVLDSIERATFDGTTIGAFETIAPLPTPLTHHATVVNGDAIYVIGGGSDLAATTEILRATVSDDGELSDWAHVGDLPEGRATASAFMFLTQLYVLGGMTTLVDGEVATVLRAPVDGLGAVGAFEELAPIPTAKAHCHQTPRYGGHLYSVAGSIAHHAQKEVWIGALE